MKITIEPAADLTEAMTSLRFFAVAVGTGIAASFFAATLEELNVWLVSDVLVVVVTFVSLMILGMAVSVAREPSLRRLTLVGFVTLVAPWFLLVILTQVSRYGIGHNAGGFSLIPYFWSCTIAGLGLLVTASVRLIRKRRK
jgi:hypothetical protein